MTELERLREDYVEACRTITLLEKNVRDARERLAQAEADYRRLDEAVRAAGVRYVRGAP